MEDGDSGNEEPKEPEAQDIQFALMNMDAEQGPSHRGLVRADDALMRDDDSDDDADANADADDEAETSDDDIPDPIARVFHCTANDELPDNGMVNTHYV